MVLKSVVLDRERGWVDTSEAKKWSFFSSIFQYTKKNAELTILWLCHYQMVCGSWWDLLNRCCSVMVSHSYARDAIKIVICGPDCVFYVKNNTWLGWERRKRHSGGVLEAFWDNVPLLRSHYFSDPLDNHTPWQLPTPPPPTCCATK